MTKKIFSLLLAISMVAGIFAFSAFAEDAYEYSQVAFFNAAGEKVPALTSGEITAKIKVKSSTSVETPYFAAILYKNNKIISAGVDDTPSALSTTAATFEAKVTVPETLSGLRLVTVLWNNIKDMKPISTSSIVPSSDARLLALSVDGEEVPNFSPDVFDYTMEIKDAGQVYAPYIRFVAANTGSLVEITDAKEFPGESTVKVTAPDGVTEKTYTITYTCDEVLLNNLTTDPADLANQYSSTGGDTMFAYHKNLQPGINMFPNRTYVLAHVDESLRGLDYITGGITMKPKSLSFNIKRGATIHALHRDHGNESANADANFPASDGWESDLTGWDRGPENNWPDEDGSYGNRIGNGLDGFPGESVFGIVDMSVVNATNSIRTQGWINHGGVFNSGGFGHRYYAFVGKKSKHFDIGSVTVNQQTATLGVPVVIEWDDFLPNDYSELSF